jgi:hypothetical protein
MKISNTILVTLALASIPTLASAAFFQDPDTGRWYEVRLASGITWAAANTQANNAIHPNLAIAGHLATINSVAENAFVASIRNQSNLPGNRPDLWIGGFQDPSAAEPAKGWKWINGEAIAETNVPSPYTNWDPLTQPPQPDNSNNSDFLAIGPGGTWYDSRPQDVSGFVIEYGDQLASFDAVLCKVSPQNPRGCNLTGAVYAGKVEMELPPLPPPGIPPAGAQYSVSTYLIHDPRVALGTCGKDPLVFLDPVTQLSPVELPATLCGDPDFVVTKVTSQGTPFQITKDIVQVTGATELLNNQFDCFAPLPPDTDQTHRDVVGYQPSQGPIFANLAFNANVHHPALKGTVEDLTNLCGSGRTGGPGRSLYFFGLRYFVPAGFTSHGWLLEVTSFKFDVQLFAIQQAKPALKNGDFTSLMSQTSAAKGDLTNGNFGEALVHLENVRKVLNAAVFKATGKNDHGEIKARNEALIFTIKEKLQGAQ